MPKPVHFRLLAAYEECFQEGLNPTDTVIAQKLTRGDRRVHRETVNRWRRQNLALRLWLFEQLGRTAAELRPLVDRRVTALAIRGSADHTKLFYQFVAKVGTPFGDAPGVQPGGGTGTYILNLLVPRPELPPIEQAGERRLPLIPRPPMTIELDPTMTTRPRRLPPATVIRPATKPAAAIPTVAIR